MKQSIAPEKILANIYSNIGFIVDVQGTSKDGIEKAALAISELMDSDLYRRIEDNYTYEEINAWNERTQRDITNQTRQKILENETVVRYVSKDETEIITIGKLYIEMKLIYGRSFCLKDKMELMGKIVHNFFTSDKFVCMENMVLIKNNTIVCDTLQKIYECFSANAFGDIRVGMENDTNVSYVEHCGNSIVELGEYTITVDRKIVEGTFNDNNAYMGKLDFTIADCGREYEGEEGIIRNLNEMNRSIFRFFISHLTDPFIADLENGTTDKVIGGFKKNDDTYTES